MARRGKGKGSSFERWVCVQLSRAVTKGKRKDVFWRSAMSGGRATVSNRKRIDVRQAGDVCAVAFEGNYLVDHFYFECKFYRDVKLDRFIVEKRGPLAKFWRVAKAEAGKHKRTPILIVKQNFLKPFVIMPRKLRGNSDPDYRVMTFKRWMELYA